MKRTIILMALLAISVASWSRVITDSIKSNILKATVKVNIYLPEEFDRQPQKKYPVLYLLHGLTDTYRAWVDKGHLDKVADEMISKGENLNSLKAKMHNRALNNLHKEYIDVIAIYVDQFVSEERYYSYLDKKDEPILKGISFKTKGESRFPSVAVASVIARYYFLLEKDKLEAKYGLEFPFGAGKKADEFKKILLDKVGQEEFDKLVKQNFKNYSK